MDYEKKYNEALKRARELRDKALAYNANHYVKDYETIFPELRESEDEKIRRELIEYLRGDLDDITTDDTDRWVAYLEKQKEQKPAEWSDEDENKIESIKGLITTGRFADTNTIRTIWKLLDSIRPRPSWKPSESQMYALKVALETFRVRNSDNISAGNDKVFTQIESLYEDLKNL